MNMCVVGFGRKSNFNRNGDSLHLLFDTKTNWSS